MKTLLINCNFIKKISDKYELFKNQFIVLEDDLISYIGEDRPLGNFDCEYDFSNRLLMPGLVNCHGHSSMVLFKNIKKAHPLQEWLNNVVYPIEDKMVPDDVKIGTQMALLEMISSGTTSFVDMYDFPYAELDSIAKSGVVGHLCRVALELDKNLEMKDCKRYSQCLDFISILNGEKDFNEEMLNEIRVHSLSEETKKALKEQRIVGDFAFHSIYLSTPKMVEAITKVNKERKLNLQLHLSETQSEVENCYKEYGCSPVEYFNNFGCFDCHTLAAHCVNLSDNDLNILKEKNVSLVHNPVSNKILESGHAPIYEALQKGINIAIGTDGCGSNGDLDMFKEMRFAWIFANEYCKNGTSVSASEVLDMGTINGGKAIRRKTGSIEVGYKADIIALDDSSFKYSEDIAKDILTQAKPEFVTDSFIDGTIIYSNKKFLTLDKNEIVVEFNKILKRLDLER